MLPVKRIMILGGGRIGFYVAKTLEERGIHVKVIEQDVDRKADRPLALHAAPSFPGRLLA